MKVLVIGGGGREHALVWALAKSPQVSRLYAASGNGGTAALAENVPIPADDLPALLAFALREGIAYTVVGPEAPLAAGIVDRFQEAGLAIFGPTKAAARLESSKVFAKTFMREEGIPTAPFAVFTNLGEALDYVETAAHRLVVKASGLAAGKGVIVCDSREEAAAAVRRMLLLKEFGAAGEEIVIEECLTGAELSVMAFCDGETIALMPPARDHKRVGDGDQGANTGGMGAFSPVPGITPEQLGEIQDRVILPVVRGMARRGTPFQGVLYAGIMLTPKGISVLEFNTRFGDPETQVVLPLLKGDLLEVLTACNTGKLAALPIVWQAGSCATVVAAAPGYPNTYPTGAPITLPDAYPPHTMFFQAGTALKERQLVTAGGRVLSVSGRGATLEQALARAYAGMDAVHFEGMHYRRDIGKTSLISNSSAQEGETRSAEVSAYAVAGVSIDAGNQATRLMSAAVKATYNAHVLAGIGSFGGLYSAAALKDMSAPILVASTDGVGTKTKVAAQLGRWDTIGQDLVNHCLNDILVQGARPLFFLDYVASAKLHPERMAAVVGGVAAACRAADCALIGGETAEMPGVYHEGEIDLVGTVIGVVERAHLIDGSTIEAGDVILGLPSAGLHTNGYSLARRALADLDWRTPHPDLEGESVGDVLLRVHRPYGASVAALQRAGVTIRGLAHITGGGLLENPPRIFPPGLGATIRRAAWIVPPIFRLIERVGKVDPLEMYRVFNMGIGMIAVVPPEQAERALAALPAAYRIGQIVRGTGVMLT